MADAKALVIQSGQYKQIPSTDTLLAGAGIKSAVGQALTITSDTGNAVLASSLDVAANINITALAGTGAFDFSGGTGLFKTSTGAVTIGSGAISVTGDMTIQAGKTLATTGTGNINLPNNGSAKFQIEGVAVGATVTAANLDTLTNGSNADALHTHAFTVSTVSFVRTAGEDINIGAPVAAANFAGASKYMEADADGAGNRPNVIGFANAASSDGNPVTVVTDGEFNVPDLRWSGSLPAVGDTGAKVFLSESLGKVTLTAPSTAGSTVIKVGIISHITGSANGTFISIQIGDGVVL